MKYSSKASISKPSRPSCSNKVSRKTIFKVGNPTPRLRSTRTGKGDERGGETTGWTDTFGEGIEGAEDCEVKSTDLMACLSVLAIVEGSIHNDNVPGSDLKYHLVLAQTRR